MAFEVRVSDRPNACVAQIEGDIDITVVPELKEALEEVLEAGCLNVVLDLTAVTYADSSALSLLVWLDRRLGPIGGRMVLTGANRDVTRILELSGLVQVAGSVSTSPSVPAALEGLDLSEIAAEPLWTKTVRMAPRVDQLAKTREEVSAQIEGLMMGEAALFDIRVALGEALANAVRHGSPEANEQPIEIETRAFEDRVVIRVMDCGCGFDGRQSSTSDVYASGGRGIMFMRALMDRVEFAPSPSGGTTVTLIKHRGAASAI
jgi:stage II sporulation protein AA (anti-sigma F factor antagonist)